ncbi:aminoglycoside phosphotransferase family protein [Aquipuribacter hungaricus]|uniref:Aminoglycoside phosphotransferase family protein n=1 Tax=Aquipuribacter hungaricus TaxID=545624 RepID=A0ABV7WJL7_9MICO
MGPPIDADLVRRLVAAQHPRWRHLPVRPVPVQGHDNRSYRLGEELIVRLPTEQGYVPAVAKEQRWLPRLAPRLPCPVPLPVAAGEPGEGYPFPWSVLRWVPGETALVRLPADTGPLARDLAGFVLALQACPAEDGPLAGAHSFARGQHPSVYDAEVRRSLPRLRGLPGAEDLDVDALARVWDGALATRWDGPPRWFHGDLAAGNVLVGADDRLAGVVDLGTCGVGDPACDLTVAWTVLDRPGREVFRGLVGADEGTWERGRAWVLWKAALVAAEEPGSRAVALELLRLVLVLDER